MARYCMGRPISVARPEFISTGIPPYPNYN